MRIVEPGFESYLEEIGGNRVLTREEEVALFERLGAGEDQVHEEIVHCNLKFVIQIARKFLGRGLPLEDLVQEGNIGLLEAIGRFDCTLGFRFSTYAAFWIRQSVQVAVRQRGSIIRIPVRKSRQLGFMSEIMQEYLSVHGRPPSEEELAERLGIKVENARELARLGEAVLSLDATDHPDIAPLMDQLSDPEATTAEATSMEEQLKEKVRSAMRFLTEREGCVIRNRFGLDSGDSLSLRRVSRTMGLSQEGVRRIEQRALNKLRRPYVRHAIAGLL